MPCNLKTGWTMYTDTTHTQDGNLQEQVTGLHMHADKPFNSCT